MRQYFHTHQMETKGPGLYLLDLEPALHRSGIKSGLLSCFIRHSSASLIIQENADPDVLRDLEAFFLRLVSRDPVLYRHREEGTDDMPAHIRAALLPTSLSIPLRDGQLMLGTWQGVYVFEHRDAPHRRAVECHLIGD